MKKYLVVILFLNLLIPFISPDASAQAQVPGSVSGQVKDNANNLAAYASVTLLKSKDSSLVKGAITDANGNYYFEKVQPGNYLVSASFVGKASTYSEPFSLTPGHPEEKLPIITLQSDARILKDVHIKAVKPFIQHKPGQTIVNVENSSVSAGNTVMEVLEKSPGVFVDQDGNISLNGKGGVNVMINDRPTHLTASQLSSVLKGMPASSVSSIELMTQPPAKYSAEGTAGLINIVLKKNTALGFNGSLTAGAGYGQYGKYNAGGSINYKNKHFGLYSNYNFNHTKNKYEMDIDRYFYAPDSKVLQTSMKQASDMKNEGNNHTAQLGMDFYLTPKQTLGFVANGSFNQGNFDSYSPVYFLNGSNHTDSLSTSTNHIGYNWQNESANAHYKIDIKKGSSLTANLDYNYFQMSMPQSLFTNVTDAQGNQLHDPDQRRGTQPSAINIYAAKLDYVHPMKHDLNLEAGLKYSFVNSDNNSQFEILKDDQWVNDPGNTNHFIYKENVNAAYLNLSKKLKKGWSVNVGVRGEQTITHTDQMNSDSLNKNNYFELFPNVSLSKMINPNNILSLSYARRIDRPDYQSLNPFIYYVDEYTYREGNPFLKPQFVNSAELSYTFHRKYSAVLNYSHTSDVITRIIRQVDSTHVDYQTQGNLSKLNSLTLTLGIPIKITPWWHTYNSLQGFYDMYDGIYNGYLLDKGITRFMLYTQQSFTLPAGFKGELTGMYQNKSIIGPSVLQPFGILSAGISKSLLKDKATLKLNVQDILQSMRFKSNIDFGNLHGGGDFKLNDRAVNLTFTWNFGNQKVKVHQYKDSGIQKEKSRIEKGNGQPGK